MVENFGEFTIETTPISRRQGTKYTVRQGDDVICWLKQQGSRIERHIIPEYRNQFRDFLRQWRATNGHKFPFTY